MKKFKKICILIILLTLAITVFNFCYAAGGGEVLNSFTGKDMSADNSGKKIAKILAAVLNGIRLTGAGIATIILLVIGFKYAIASVGERADIKKYAMNYVIGALILFGATGLLTIVKNIITESLNSGEVEPD